jgi:hypothetical protein
MATKDNLTIGLTGSQEPDNFTIRLYEWDVTGGAEALRTTYATGVTRNTLSTTNGGTLALGTYGITGITGNDYYMKLTASNKCGSSAIFALNTTSLALSVLNQVPVTSNYSSQGNPDTAVFTGQYPNQVTNGALHPEIAWFDGPFYLADDAPSYPSIGYGSIFTSGFTIEHLGTYNMVGDTISGKWVNGLLENFTLVQSQTSPYKRYSINGYQIPGIAIDESAPTYRSQIRITFNPSGSSRTFNYYWVGSNV